MNTTQQELIEALARRLNGQRPTPARRQPADEAEPELDVLIEVDEPGSRVIDLTQL